MSSKDRVLIDAIQGVPTDPNAQDDRLNGEIMELDHSIAQNESDKRAIQRLTADKRMTQKQASTATQIIDANNAKLKKIRAELEEKQKKNKAAKQPAPDKPVVPNVQGLLFSRRVSVDQIINNALGRDQGYQCTADKPLKQVLQERFNDHLSGRFPLPPQESLKLRADLQAEFDREHPGQQSAWPAYSNDEQAYIRDEAEKKAANDNNLTIATQSAFAGGAVAAGYTAGADPRTVNKFGTAVLAAEGLLGARRGGQGKKSPQNSVPASTRNPQPTTPRPTPQSNARGAGNGVVVVRSGATNRGATQAVELAFDKSTRTWTTPAGLDYGPGSVHGNRVKHVLDHAVPNPNKTTHSVFNVDRKEVLGLVDEAWLARSKPLPNDPGAYVVPMGRTVGTAGETNIKIIVRPGTTKIITAYPWQ